MAEATFVHDGDAVDYTPGADAAAGEVVVQGTLVGVTKTPITAGRLGAIAVRGVFDVAKDATTEFTAGQTVFWDEATKKAVDTGTIVFGKAVADAGNGATSVRTLITPGVASGNQSVGPV